MSDLCFEKVQNRFGLYITCHICQTDFFFFLEIQSDFTPYYYILQIELAGISESIWTYIY